MQRKTITRAEFMADPGKYFALAKEFEIEVLGDDDGEPRIYFTRNVPPLDEDDDG